MHHPFHIVHVAAKGLLTHTPENINRLIQTCHIDPLMKEAIHSSQHIEKQLFSAKEKNVVNGPVTYKSLVNCTELELNE